MELLDRDETLEVARRVLAVSTADETEVHKQQILRQICAAKQR